MSKAIIKGFSGPKWMMEALHEAARLRDQNDSEWLRRAIVNALMDQGIDFGQFTSDEDARKSRG